VFTQYIIEFAPNETTTRNAASRVPNAQPELTADAFLSIDAGTRTIHDRNDRFLWLEGGVRRRPSNHGDPSLSATHGRSE
jgi:hypothetical protein